MNKIKIIYVTTKDKTEAQKIGRHLVEERLAACVNIIDGMQSMYFWEGKVQEENEVILIAKTLEEKVSAVIQKVKELHSYDCPCIVSLPVEAGNKAFLKWVAEQVH